MRSDRVAYILQELSGEFRLGGGGEELGGVAPCSTVGSGVWKSFGKTR